MFPTIIDQWCDLLMSFLVLFQIMICIGNIRTYVTLFIFFNWLHDVENAKNAWLIRNMIWYDSGLLLVINAIYSYWTSHLTLDRVTYPNLASWWFILLYFNSISAEPWDYFYGDARVQVTDNRKLNLKFVLR